MGTLTGNTPSLPDHCDHKLPTSCRLTASPKCCACQDIRPHTGLYTTYVDGVGLVQRGTRWQRYCFFCREFWENRVSATDPPVSPKDTRIPDIPDQTPFIERWFEFHRGYKTVVDADNGHETLQPITCEKPWRDVDPGELPLLSDSERKLILTSTIQGSADDSGGTISLDATLDQLLEATDQEHEQEHQLRRGTLSNPSRLPPPPPIVNAPENITPGELVAARLELRHAERRQSSAQLRRQRATCELEAAERELSRCTAETAQAQQQQEQVESRLEHQRVVAQQALLDPQLERDQRAALRFARVFGTREEIERQGADYISPLTSLFTRAYERYHVAEEVRAEERASLQNSQQHQEILANLAEHQFPHFYSAIQRRVETEIRANEPVLTLDDNDEERPPPKTNDQMVVDLQCRVCLQQICDTALLPCGHLVMCSYCAKIVVPARPNDQTQPLWRHAQCPQCRKQIKRIAKIITT